MLTPCNGLVQSLTFWMQRLYKMTIEPNQNAGSMCRHNRHSRLTFLVEWDSHFANSLKLCPEHMSFRSCILYLLFKGHTLI